MEPVATDLLSCLERDPRISSTVPHGDGLLITIDDELIQLMLDPIRDRTIIWTLVRRLASAEIAIGALAAATFNQQHYERAGLVMGLDKERSNLILGHSLDGTSRDEQDLIDALLDLRGTIEPARSAFIAASKGDRPAQNISNPNIPDQNIPGDDFIRI